MSFENGNFFCGRLQLNLVTVPTTWYIFRACQEKKGYGLDAVTETKSSQFYQDLQIEMTYSKFHTLPPWSLFPALKT